MHRPAKDAVLKDAVRAELFVPLDVVRGKHVRLLFFVDLDLLGPEGRAALIPPRGRCLGAEGARS